jgi:hypothetical protein
MTIALAVMVITTGVPWTEIHAHEIAADSGNAPHSHHDQRHEQAPMSDDLHVHDLGLFGSGPLASGPLLLVPHARAAEIQFAEPRLLPHQANHTPPLRPPARS